MEKASMANARNKKSVSLFKSRGPGLAARDSAQLSIMKNSIHGARPFFKGEAILKILFRYFYIVYTHPFRNIGAF
jgi:hypothetical protein